MFAAEVEARTASFADLSWSEEAVNCLTHLVGFALSVAATFAMLAECQRHASPGQVLGATAFGLSMMAVYLASTVYHAVRDPRRKQSWQVVDHAAIFLLIAGTYTPFLLTLPRPLATGMLVTIWGLAAAGVLLKMILGCNYHKVSLATYLTMGWLGLVVLKPLVEVVPVGAVILLLAGAVAYTLGTVFFVREQVRYSHAVWHVLVMLGTAFHYLAIAHYIVPLSA